MYFTNPELLEASNLTPSDMEAFARVWLATYGPSIANDAEFKECASDALRMIVCYGDSTIEELDYRCDVVWGGEYETIPVSATYVDDKGEEVLTLTTDNLASHYVRFAIDFLLSCNGVNSGYVASTCRNFLAGDWDAWACSSDPVDCGLFAQFIVR